MRQRRRTRALFVILLTALATTRCVSAKGPNVLLIFTDDQGMHDVGCYGSEIPTPHIDSLARDGMRFTQWYSASSICTPSRFGLLTGKNPSRSRDRLLGALMFLSEADRVRGIQPGEETLPTRLAAVGYHTALLGKWHLGHGGPAFSPLRHGFTEFYGHTGGCVDFYTMRYGNIPDWYRQDQLIDVTGYATDVITREAVALLQRRQRETEPFFLLLAYNAPHFGKGWNDGKGETVNQLQPPPADLGRVAGISDITRRKYAAKVVNLDDAVGQVLATLEQTGLSESTLVIFLTDHGGDPVYGGANHPFRGAKATLFEGGIRVPCLMRWPGVIPAGRVSDHPCWSIDLPPTLAALCGAPPRAADGVDLSTHLAGAEWSHAPREMYWELGTHDLLARGRWQALRQAEWKWIVDDQGQEHLFHLREDPAESRNRAQSERGRAAAMRARAAELARVYAQQ